MLGRPESGLVSCKTQQSGRDFAGVMGKDGDKSEMYFYNGQ